MQNLKSTGTIVLVEGFAVPAYIGPESAERDSIQNLMVDISCELSNPGVESDLLANTADYVPMVEAIRELGVAKKRNLIETLAEEIAEICFQNPSVGTVTVTVRKPKKLPDVENVGVTRTFTR